MVSKPLSQAFADAHLTWFPELDLGWFPVQAFPYDSSYWQQYRQWDSTPMGAALTRARVDLVRRHAPELLLATHGEEVPRLVDVGIGGGRFVRESGAHGYDVNPDAVHWLQDEERYWDVYNVPVPALTFWDSLEHIHNADAVLRQAEEWVFVSLPIFYNVEHVLRSKHYKKTEHCWYFTDSSFIWFMGKHGFTLAESNFMESALGREDIRSYAFRRI